jgi:hypothetical protein
LALSAQGKFWGDPEGGEIKRWAEEHNTKKKQGSRGETPMRNGKDAAAACADPAKGSLPLSKNFTTVKRGNGIWKRKVTHAGKSDVNRRHTKGKKVVDELTSKMHVVCSIGEAGKATFRRRARFGCVACDSGRCNDCPEKDRCGLPNTRTIIAETQNPLAFAHMKENRQFWRAPRKSGTRSLWNARAAATPLPA